jgi:TonB family protein
MRFRKLLVMFVLAPLVGMQPSARGEFALVDPIRAQTATPEWHAASQDKKGEWQRYTVDDEEFSVLLPILPMMNTSAASIAPNRERRERKLGAYDEGVVYTIFTYEKKMLTIDELIRNTTTKLESAQVSSVTVSGVMGKSFKNEDANRMREVQFFATKTNLYVFQALGSKLGNPATGIPKFFSSINFEKPPAGIKVEDGPGDEPASNMATPSDNPEVFQSKQVSLKVGVVLKPEPRYTERARMKQIVGTVVLRGVFSSSGTLTNITVLRKLPEGLTERAIDAAKKIRFIPAIKDGRFVSMWIQLEYNFNLY